MAAWVHSRLHEHGASTVTVVAAGERWSDGSLRRDIEYSLPDALRECSGGVELSEAGFGDDVGAAARLDASRCVPVLDEARFVDAVGRAALRVQDLGTLRLALERVMARWPQRRHIEYDEETACGPGSRTRWGSTYR